MENNKENKRKVDIGIVCASGIGISRLMHSKLKRFLKERAELVTYGKEDCQAGYNQFTHLSPAGPRETVELAQGYNAMIGLVEKNITSLSDSNRQLATTIAELEIEQDRLQFYKDTPGEAGARRAVAEFNLLSGELLADDAFYAMLQLSPSLLKFSLSDFLNDMAEPEDAAAVQEQLDAQADQVHQLVRIHTAQGLRFIKVHARVYYNMQAEPTKVSATLLDVTSAYTPAPEDDLQDSATGLATKTPFLQALTDALSAEDANREGGLVACQSLQNLPKEEGQRTARILALRISADRLRAFAAPEGMAARLDGDRFLLHLPHLGQPDLAEACLAELDQALSAPIPWQKTTLTLKMLAGAALYPQPKGATAELLVSQAQTAMSAAAVAGSVSWMLFDPARQAEDADTARLALESALRGRKITEALSTFQEDDSLSLEYQPILQLWTGSVEGFECTVRLRVPELGMVSAGELIPLAEKNGMMLKVGRYVLKEACRRIRILRLRQKQELYISVNISAQQLEDPVFTDTVYLTLKETSLPGSALQLEISERIMDTLAAQADKLRALRQLGVRIALDDYGAGTGSLAHLYNMPLDVLKVSRNFLTGSSFSMGKEFILKTMVDLAHNLNLKVAAVGVEHTSRLNTLMKLGYDMAQGYHFCPPLEPAALEVFLDTRAQEGNR
jgi:EAL domain-containing protein (putative c-di-GMP-specific phosphodiesterase class I)/GGDEF domain-containing protein